MPSETTPSSLTTTDEPFEQDSACAFFQASYSACNCASVSVADFALFQVAGALALLAPAALNAPPAPPPEATMLGAAPALPPSTGLLPVAAEEPAEANPALGALLGLAESPHAGKNAQIEPQNSNEKRSVMRSARPEALR